MCGTKSRHTFSIIDQSNNKFIIAYRAFVVSKLCRVWHRCQILTFMMNSNCKKSFGLHGLYKIFQPSIGCCVTICPASLQTLTLANMESVFCFVYSCVIRYSGRINGSHHSTDKRPCHSDRTQLFWCIRWTNGWLIFAWSSVPLRKCYCE